MGDSQLPEGWYPSPAGYYYRHSTHRHRHGLKVYGLWNYCWYAVYDPWNHRWRITDGNPTRVERGRPQQFLLEGVGFQDPVAAMVAANIELANRSDT